jgi:N-acetylglucosamine-6-phosphate deacetylase
VPRPTKRVKSFGAIDLHFHGAFGIDLMSAGPSDLDSLSAALKQKGVAGFCATTLSASEKDLATAVTRLGAWIRSGSAPGAKPLGIHLEGPFISLEAAGAHPPGILRKLRMGELEKLWDLSKETLRIVTIAPETLDAATRSEVTAWAKKKRVRLAIGHTRCTATEAETAFDSGFSGVTHAWNALSYHHREPGVLGAAFGRKETWVELIPDEIHVHPTLIDWTLALHPKGTFFVSDAAPAAGTDGSHFHRFGDLECRFQDRASRLPDGRLAGGGYLLPESFGEWIARESARKSISPAKLLKLHLARIHELPLRAIFMGKTESNRLLKRFPVTWAVTKGSKKALPKIAVASTAR